MKKYEAPRAVRLRDAPTGTFQCVSGGIYSESCVTGDLVGLRICDNGGSPQPPTPGGRF